MFFFLTCIRSYDLNDCEKHHLEWTKNKRHIYLTENDMVQHRRSERERTACADFNDDERGPTVFDLCLFIIR